MRDRVKGWLRSIAKKIKRTRLGKWLSRQWREHPARLAAYILLFVSFLAFLANFLPYKLAQDFAANFATEFFSLALTVIIIDRLYEGIQDRQLKEQLILQMGSRHNDVTDTAIRTLKAREWDKDGSLKGAYLKNANLQKLGLAGANLEEANLGGADLRYAYLKGVNLEGAKLIETNLKGAYLREANLEGANLLGANLERATLDEAKLKGAQLFGVNLKGVFLEGVNLEGVNLRYVNLQEARLRGTNLEGAITPDGWIDEQAVAEIDKAMSQANTEEE